MKSVTGGSFAKKDPEVPPLLAHRLRGRTRGGVLPAPLHARIGDAALHSGFAVEPGTSSGVPAEQEDKSGGGMARGRAAQLGWDLLLKPSRVVMKVCTAPAVPAAVPQPARPPPRRLPGLAHRVSPTGPRADLPAQNGASFETMVCFNRRPVTFQDVDSYDHAAVKGVKDTTFQKKGRITSFMTKFGK